MIEAALVARLAPIIPDIYPLEAPPGASFPCLVYARSKTDPLRDFDGRAGDWIVIHVDTYHQNFMDAKALANAVRSNLEAWSDMDVQTAALVDEADAVDKTTKVTLFRVVQTFLLLTV